MHTSTGTVYEGRCRGLRVAIKVLNDQKMDAKSLRKFKDEVELMAYVTNASQRSHLPLLTTRPRSLSLSLPSPHTVDSTTRGLYCFWVPACSKTARWHA